MVSGGSVPNALTAAGVQMAPARPRMNTEREIFMGMSPLGVVPTLMRTPPSWFSEV
jgi:hypothetical protein